MDFYFMHYVSTIASFTRLSSLRRRCFPPRQRHRSLAGSLLRLVLVLSLITTGILANLATESAHAALASSQASNAASTVTPPHTYTGVRSSSPSATIMSKVKDLAVTSNAKKTTQTNTATLTASKPLNGLGNLPLYTYIDKKLSDRLDLKVNVSNGNLLLHSTELQVASLGLNLNLGGYYNSQNAGQLIDHGTNWQFTMGNGAWLDLSNTSAGITFHDPSGYAAFFAPDTQKGSNIYDDVQPIDASLVYQPASGDDNAYYQLLFHHTGIEWDFNLYGSFTVYHDKNINYLYNSFNDQGDWTGTTDTIKRSFPVSHNVNRQVSSITDPTNRSITYGYDSNNNLVSITDASGQTTTFGYDSSAHLTRITDPDGNTTTMSYTSSGQISTITDANKGVTQFTYTSGATVVTDAKSHATTYTYNTSTLQVTSTKDALGHVSATAFDATGYNVASTTDALGDVSNFTYDTNNNETSSTDATGAKTTMTYPQSLTAGQQQNVLYDPLTQTNPQGNETDYSYDTNGNALSATDKSSNNSQQETYNGDGTISSSYIQSTDSTGKTVQSHVTLYSYDSNGNLMTVTSPSPLGKTTMTYDSLSRLASETDGDGHKTTYQYDTLDRITTIVYSDGSSIHYTYDYDGNVTSETDATGTTIFVFDALNRELKKTLPSGTILTSAYDGLGNLTSLNDGTGIIGYSYDAVNRLVTLTDPSGAQTTYGYDSNNHKTSILYPNATGMLMSYDEAGRELTNTGGKITMVNGMPVVTTTYTNFRYAYAPSGTTQSKDLLQSAIVFDQVSQNSTTSNAYSYDSQSQLTTATTNNGSSQVSKRTYSYDSNGNRTSDSYTGTTTNSNTYTYNDANELMQASNTGTFNGTQGTITTTYAYDGNGNRTGVSNNLSTFYPQVDPTQSHTYNVADQDVSGSTLGSNTYTYSYSGTNQTDRVKVNGASAVYSSLGLSSETTSSGTNEYIRCSCGLLNSERTANGKSYYYLFDGEGSIVGMTDSSGNDVNRYAYDPFGHIVNSLIQNGINNPWTYAGGYTDATTGLVKFGIRYYDATIGRWTQATPVGGSLQEVTKANPYVYADNDPIGKVDPNGKNSIQTNLLLCLGGAVFFLVGLAILTVFTAGIDIGAAAIATAVAGVSTGTVIGTLVSGCITTIGIDYVTQIAHQ